MPWLAGANKVVIGQPQPAGKGLPSCRQAVAVILRIETFRRRRLLHFLAVFVDPRQKKNFFAEASAGANHHVGNHFLIGVPQVRLSVDVVDGRRDVKSFAHPSVSLPHESARPNKIEKPLAVKDLVLSISIRLHFSKSFATNATREFSNGKKERSL